MNVAILSGALTPRGRAVVDLLSAHQVAISVVIIETDLRTASSSTERAYQEAHAAHELLRNRGRTTKGRTLAQYSSLPAPARAFVRRWAHRIPILARRTVVRAATDRGIPVKFVRRMSSEATRRMLERYEIDFALLCASQWLVKEPLLSMRRARIINAHCGKLPEHRSLDSIGWSVLAGDATGITSHLVDSGVDTGPVLMFREVRPIAGEGYRGLASRIDDAIPGVLLETIQGLAARSIHPVTQAADTGVHHRPMTLPELQRVDEMLDGQQPAAVQKPPRNPGSA